VSGSYKMSNALSFADYNGIRRRLADAILKLSR
jgi:hypothetical protein